MDRIKIMERFNTLYLGDSLLQRVELRIPEAEFDLLFNAGKILVAQRGSIFEPEATFAPARLRLTGVRSLSCEGGVYQLNSTVVDFGATEATEAGHVEFYIDLTGGHDPDMFLVRLRITARDFEFGSYPSEN